MGANRLWRFVLIGLVPAALTAAVLGGLLAVAKSSQGCATRRAQATAAASIAAPQQAQGTARSAYNKQGQQGQHVQLTRWHDGDAARGWYMQRGDAPCAFGPSGQRCTFAAPARLSVVIPERPEARHASALTALAGLVASAPPSVQVDVIHYAGRPGAAPAPATQAPDVVELMLCAQIADPATYQGCVDALSPRLERGDAKPAHFWQVTTGASADASEAEGPSLARLLDTLQPRPGAAVVLLGDWSEAEALAGAEHAQRGVHLTVVSGGVDARAPRASGLGCGVTAARADAADGVTTSAARLTPSSLALFAQADANAETLRAAVWRRFSPQTERGYGARAERGAITKRAWYKRYLKGLIAWYGVGALLLVSLWAGLRARRQQQAACARDRHL